MGLFSAECGTCERKVKYCVCEKTHGNQGKAHRYLPEGGRGSDLPRRRSNKDHAERCREQGWRGLSTW